MERNKKEVVRSFLEAEAGEERARLTYEEAQRKAGHAKACVAQVMKKGDAVILSDIGLVVTHDGYRGDHPDIRRYHITRDSLPPCPPLVEGHE